MIELRAARSVRSATELKAWFAPLRDDRVCLEQASRAARAYAERNCGATTLITEALLKHL